MEDLLRECSTLEDLRFKNSKLLQEKEAIQKGVTDQNSRLQEGVDSAELDYELEKKARDDVEKQFKKMEGSEFEIFMFEKRLLVIVNNC